MQINAVYLFFTNIITRNNDIFLYYQNFVYNMPGSFAYMGAKLFNELLLDIRREQDSQKLIRNHF